MIEPVIQLELSKQSQATIISVRKKNMYKKTFKNTFWKHDQFI